jgi:hypothetical protein
MFQTNKGSSSKIWALGNARQTIHAKERRNCRHQQCSFCTAPKNEQQHAS